VTDWVEVQPVLFQNPAYRESVSLQGSRLASATSLSVGMAYSGPDELRDTEDAFADVRGDARRRSRTRLRAGRSTVTAGQNPQPLLSGSSEPRRGFGTGRGGPRCSQVGAGSLLWERTIVTGRGERQVPVLDAVSARDESVLNPSLPLVGAHKVPEHADTPTEACSYGDLRAASVCEARTL